MIRRHGKFSFGWNELHVVALVWAMAMLMDQSALAQPIPDADTLLLLQFDESVHAAYAVGTAAVDAGTAVPESGTGRFGGGLELVPGDRVAIVGDDGNLQPAEGTIEFWCQLNWAGDAPEKHSFLSCAMGDREFININCLGRGRLGIALAAGESDAWTWRRSDGDIKDWAPNTWHHVAFAWGSGRLCVHVDGRECIDIVTDAAMPSAPPKAIYLLGFDGKIDGLRISKRRYTVNEAQRSIREALDPPYRYLSDLPRFELQRAWADQRTLLGDVTIPLIVGARRYNKGFVCRAGGTVIVPLEKQFETFQATIGTCPLSAPDTACAFEVWGDGQKLLDSGLRTAQQAPERISVPVAGVQELRLIVRGEAELSGPARGVWAAAMALRDPASEPFIPSLQMSPATVEMYRRQQGADDFSFEPPSDKRWMAVAKYWEDEVDISQAPPPGDPALTVQGMATPGEYEPVNFVLYAFDDLDNVAVEASELRCGGRSIPADRIDVRMVLRGLMRDVYTLPPERSTVVARYLPPYRSVDMPRGTFREYHLIVHVPDDAASGCYAGKIRVTTADGDVLDIPLCMEVLPFRLRSAPGKGYGVYYRFPSMTEDWSHVDVELADILAHGGHMLKWNLGVDFEQDGDTIRPAYERLQRGLAALRKHHFHGPLPVGSGCEQAARLLDYDPVADYEDLPRRERFLQVVKSGLEGLKRVSAEYREFQFLATHMDEIFGHDRMQRFVRFTEAVRQVPDFRVYITLHNDPKRDVTDLMQRCDPFVDVRCYNGHCMDNWLRAGHSFDQLADELAEAQDEAWLYHNIRGSFFAAEWMRLVNGYYLWVSPLRVHVPWMYYSFKGNPFDATDGPRLRGGDFAYAVPDPDDDSRMIPTRHWEAYREGIDDLRYLATLESMAQEQPGTPDSDAARAWLAEFRNEITPRPEDLEPIEVESPLLVHWSQKMDGADYRRIRRQAAQWIVRLLKEESE